MDNYTVVSLHHLILVAQEDLDLPNEKRRVLNQFLLDAYKILREGEVTYTELATNDEWRLEGSFR